MKYKLIVDDAYALCTVTIEFTDHKESIPFVYNTIDVCRDRVNRILRVAAEEYPGDTDPVEAVD